MRQITTLERQRRGRPLGESALRARLLDGLFPVLMRLSRTKVSFRLSPVNEAPAGAGPVIYAVNHSAFPDTPMALTAVGHRCRVLAGKQRLTIPDDLFFHLLGAIWVDREDREDMAASKAALQEALSRGQDVLWFPEGTWNLTDNLLVLPLRWGIIDVARQAKARIVPVALDYDREKLVCRAKFGEPIGGEQLEDKATGIRTLRDAMASLRWELMADQPLLHRGGVTVAELRREMERPLSEYPMLDWEREQKAIYRPWK